jgi:hypothetical protein
MIPRRRIAARRNPGLWAGRALRARALQLPVAARLTRQGTRGSRPLPGCSCRQRSAVRGRYAARADVRQGAQAASDDGGRAAGEPGAQAQSESPSCNDGAQNGSETAEDCGGTCPGKCADGQQCNTGTDCQNGVCTDGSCQSPTYADSVPNGSETVSIAPVVDLRRRSIALSALGRF